MEAERCPVCNREISQVDDGVAIWPPFVRRIYTGADELTDLDISYRNLDKLIKEELKLIDSEDAPKQQ